MKISKKKMEVTVPMLNPKVIAEAILIALMLLSLGLPIGLWYSESCMWTIYASLLSDMCYTV